jgi:excisionase family DNA binding protein
VEQGETYTTTETARIMRISTRRVTQLLERGELAGRKDGAGRWRVSQRAVHAAISDRPPRDAPPEPRDSPQEAADLRSRRKLHSAS